MERNLERTRQDLAEFLRSRRERISLAEAGLPPTGRRRTPGLRREEVAALAGVGLSWYTWLEQGRDIGVSPAFLDSVGFSSLMQLSAGTFIFFPTSVHQPNKAKHGASFRKLFTV